MQKPGLLRAFATLPSMGGKWVHRVSNRDVERLRGECASCGPVDLVMRIDKGAVKYPCANGRLQQRDPRKWGGNKGKHGLGEADGKALRAGKTCAICGKDHDLCIDHDHGTGAIRGVLCRRCNLAIGILGDDPGMVRRALAYLENHRVRE